MKGPEGLTAAAAAASAAANTTATIKIENATEGLPPNCFHRLYDRVLLLAAGPKGKQNALTICDYIFSLRSEINPSDNYRRDVIKLLCNLSMFFNNNNCNTKS